MLLLADELFISPPRHILMATPAALIRRAASYAADGRRLTRYCLLHCCAAFTLTGGAYFEAFAADADTASDEPRRPPMTELRLIAGLLRQRRCSS